MYCHGDMFIRSLESYVNVYLWIYFGTEVTWWCQHYSESGPKPAHYGIVRWQYRLDTMGKDAGYTWMTRIAYVNANDRKLWCVNKRTSLFRTNQLVFHHLWDHWYDFRSIKLFILVSLGPVLPSGARWFCLQNEMSLHLLIQKCDALMLHEREGGLLYWSRVRNCINNTET